MMTRSAYILAQASTVKGRGLPRLRAGGLMVWFRHGAEGSPDEVPPTFSVGDIWPGAYPVSLPLVSRRQVSVVYDRAGKRR